MDVNQVTNPRTAATGQTAAAGQTAAPPVVETEEKDAKGTIDSDFNTFLTLLTTQLQNQDPLKPMESTEFVAQLASFSSVEQQIRTNDQLERIFEALGGASPAGLASWIGKEVRAATQATYSGVPVDVGTTPNAEAERAVLTVTNDFGQVVAQREVDPAAATVSWDGRDALGTPLPNGKYSFAIESYAKDELIGTVPGEVYGKVSEVRIENGAPVLWLENGAKVATDAVTALR